MHATLFDGFQLITVWRNTCIKWMIQGEVCKFLVYRRTQWTLAVKSCMVQTASRAKFWWIVLKLFHHHQSEHFAIILLTWKVKPKCKIMPSKCNLNCKLHDFEESHKKLEYLDNLELFMLCHSLERQYYNLFHALWDLQMSWTEFVCFIIGGTPGLKE